MLIYIDYKKKKIHTISKLKTKIKKGTTTYSESNEMLFKKVLGNVNIYFDMTCEQITFISKVVLG